MIDEDFIVYLIEVNTNPCFELSSNLLSRIIPNMLENALKFILMNLELLLIQFFLLQFIYKNKITIKILIFKKIFQKIIDSLLFLMNLFKEQNFKIMSKILEFKVYFIILDNKISDIEDSENSENAL